MAEQRGIGPGPAPTELTTRPVDRRGHASWAASAEPRRRNWATPNQELPTPSRPPRPRRRPLAPTASPSSPPPPSARATATAISLLPPRQLLLLPERFFQEPKRLAGDHRDGRSMFCQPKDLGARSGTASASAPRPRHRAGRGWGLRRWAELNNASPRLLETATAVWYPFAIHQGLVGAGGRLVEQVRAACAMARVPRRTSTTCAPCWTRCA